MKKIFMALMFVLLLSVPASAAQTKSLVQVGFYPPETYVDWGTTYVSDFGLLVEVAYETQVPIYLVPEKNYPGTIRLFIEPEGFDTFVDALSETELYKRVGFAPSLVPTREGFSFLLFTNISISITI